MATGSQFRDQVLWLLAEHERVEQQLRDVTIENESLRRRLRSNAVDAESTFDPESMPTSPSSMTRGRSFVRKNTFPSRHKLTGYWDSTNESDGPVESYMLPSERRASRESSMRSMDDFDDQPPEVWREWAETSWQDGSVSDRLWFPPIPRTRSMLAGEAVLDEESWCQHFIMRPNSMRRGFWDCASMSVLGYDIFFIPVEVFAYRQTWFTLGMEWASTIFWTCDICASFLTGFHRDGVVEMRPQKIARRYVKGGFALDLTVVLIDWFLALFAVEIKAILRLGKSTRAVRLLRMVRAMRLLRTFKMARMVQLMYQYFKSDLTRTLISILLMLIVIVIFNHYFACGWYAIGISFHDSWLDTSPRLEDGEDLLYSYMTALHWSLTQFTPASMEIFPRNLIERIYTICVLVFAMVTFSSFVSSITGAMMFLRTLKTEPARQEAILRQFFQDSRVSAELSQRIWIFLSNNHFQHRKRVHKNDLPILKLVPESLRNLLNEELYLPILSWNPLLRRLEKLHPSLFNEVCHRAITEKSLTTREQLFLECKVAESVYFVTSGTMYYRHQEANLCTTVNQGEWACEPALWLQWSHCGRMTARTSCEIIQLNAATFRSLAPKDRVAHTYLSNYAKHFREYVGRCHLLWYTDIWMDLRELDDIVARCAEQHPLRSHSDVAAVRSSSATMESEVSSLHFAALDAGRRLLRAIARRVRRPRCRLRKAGAAKADPATLNAGSATI